MKLSELVSKVVNGDYPDLERPTDERVICLQDNVIMYYNSIIGGILLNDIPEDKATVMIPKRLRLFDSISRSINVLRIGRLNALLEELDSIVNNASTDKDLWLTKKSMNNICTFITEFWAWDDMTRINFINGIEEDEEVEVDPEVTDIIINGTGIEEEETEV